MATDENFETCLKRLEKTVVDLEAGRLGLDDALSAYETGVGLLTKCYRMLDVADRKVAVLTGVEADGTPATAPFDASATIDRETLSPKKKGKTPKIAPDAMEDLPF